eukprot:CAMPEP_0174292470 /NCGR_PEP_ID=MMETSP0809-20121228/35598_1 /TAXON_ID=73025 ORGANISM="Eutreptiella gymnastica-like, Strain CCMP1594" /NCGR_SAMPLE_ID=MMETSP0809 /ASSEMBLY_ACC=CAM_ASM_000658 /LENGTH=169 /DNA_ID=CAMNT_0015392567 /DNA_START=43 /DNA_END=552 /DNA_ORIENTATION=+
MKDEDWESKQLEAQIEKHKQDKRTNKIATVAVALTVSLLPSYIFQAVMDMDWTAYLPYYIVTPAISAVLLTLAYQLFFEVNFTHKFAPTKQIDNVGLERMLRYQASMGYSLLFSNALFLALVLFFQFYMFRAFDKRLNYCLSTLAGAGLVYWLAQANEKTVAAKKAKTK